VSHVADIVGEKGIVYAVEFSHRSGRDLINMAKKRVNVIPIIEDARHPQKYRMLIDMVDVIFADVAQVHPLPPTPALTLNPTHPLFVFSLSFGVRVLTFASPINLELSP